MLTCVKKTYKDALLFIGFEERRFDANIDGCQIRGNIWENGRATCLGSCAGRIGLGVNYCTILKDVYVRNGTFVHDRCPFITRGYPPDCDGGIHGGNYIKVPFDLNDYTLSGKGTGTHIPSGTVFWVGYNLQAHFARYHRAITAPHVKGG